MAAITDLTSLFLLVCRVLEVEYDVNSRVPKAHHIRALDRLIWICFQHLAHHILKVDVLDGRVENSRH